MIWSPIRNSEKTMVTFGGGTVGMRLSTAFEHENSVAMLKLYRMHDSCGEPLKNPPRKPNIIVELAFTNLHSLDIVINNLCTLRKKYADLLSNPVTDKLKVSMQDLQKEIVLEFKKVSKKKKKKVRRKVKR